MDFRERQVHALERIGRGGLKPGQIISHRLPLEEAAQGYELFASKLEDCRKVVLNPVGADPLRPA